MQLILSWYFPAMLKITAQCDIHEVLGGGGGTTLIILVGVWCALTNPSPVSDQSFKFCFPILDVLLITTNTIILQN